ncbi:MAG TPA: SGNH/GDSL hydrolase family protein, partial [Streptomyces sp.]
MPRRQGYALLIALVAGTAVLAAAVAFGTSYLTGTRHAPLGRGVAHPAAHHPAAPATSTGTWVATWTGAPVSGEPHTEHGFPERTIRNTVHTSIGGHAARITLSNLFGTVPLVIDRATVAARPVTFRGAHAVSIPAGRQVVSDPVVVNV